MSLPQLRTLIHMLQHVKSVHCYVNHEEVSRLAPFYASVTIQIAHKRASLFNLPNQTRQKHVRLPCKHKGCKNRSFVDPELLFEHVRDAHLGTYKVACPVPGNVEPRLRCRYLASLCNYFSLSAYHAIKRTSRPLR